MIGLPSASCVAIHDVQERRTSAGCGCSPGRRRRCRRSRRDSAALPTAPAGRRPSSRRSRTCRRSVPAALRTISFDDSVITWIDAVAIVDHLLGMALAELHVVAGVAGVGARGRVAAAQRVGHRRVADRARVAAVADALELAVPRLSGRNPDLELDLGIARRPRGRLDAAERRQRRSSPSASPAA